jgi:hypothetical protein
MDQETKVPQRAECMSFQPDLIEEVPTDRRFNEIANGGDWPLDGSRGAETCRGGGSGEGVRRAERSLGEGSKGIWLLIDRT